MAGSSFTSRIDKCHKILSFSIQIGVCFFFTTLCWFKIASNAKLDLFCIFRTMLYSVSLPRCFRMLLLSPTLPLGWVWASEESLVLCWQRANQQGAALCRSLVFLCSRSHYWERLLQYTVGRAESQFRVAPWEGWSQGRSRTQAGPSPATLLPLKGTETPPDKTAQADCCQPGVAELQGARKRLLCGLRLHSAILYVEANCPFNYCVGCTEIDEHSLSHRQQPE